MINNKINYPKAISTWLKRFNMNVESLMNQVKHSEEIMKILECSKEYPSYYEFVEICNGLGLTLYEFFDEDCEVFEGNFKAYNFSFSIKESLQRLIDEHHKTAMGISCSMKMPQLAIESILDGSNPDPSMKNVSKILVACNTQLYDFFAQSEFEEFNPQMSEEVKQEEKISEVEENGASSNKEVESTDDAASMKSCNLTLHYTREEIGKKSANSRIANRDHIKCIKDGGSNDRRMIADYNVQKAIKYHYDIITDGYTQADVANRVGWSSNIYTNKSHIQEFRNGCNTTFKFIIKFCDAFHVSLYEFLNPKVTEFSYFEGKNSDFNSSKTSLELIYAAGFNSVREFMVATNPKCNVIALRQRNITNLQINSLIALCDALGIELYEFFASQSNKEVDQTKTMAKMRRKKVLKTEAEKQATSENTPVAKLMLQYRKLTLEEKNLFLTMLLAEK